MLIHDDKYNTKEVVKSLEKSYTESERFRTCSFLWGCSAGVSIHTKADWNSYEGFTNQNIVTTLDNVLAEGGDY